MEGFRVIVLEGFEMTGKSTMIDALMKLLESKYNYKCYYYHPDYRIYNKFDKSRNIMWLNGITIYDFIESNLSELKDQNICIFIDRGVASSLVYSKITSGHDYSQYKDLIESYNSMKSITEYTTLILMKHKNKKLSEKVYYRGKARSSNEDRDNFESFEEYSRQYSQYTKEYKEVIKMIKYSEVLTACINE